MKFFDYVVQDAKARYGNNSFLKCLIRYFRLPSFKLLVNYRAAQYILNNRGGILLVISRLRLERINSKYCTTLFEGLKAGEGLSFPHYGPFVINEGLLLGNTALFTPPSFNWWR